MSDSYLEMNFPAAGIDLRFAFSDQRPREVGGGVYARSTPSGTNVLAYEASKDRRRGGTRGGLVKQFPAAVVAGWVIQDLNVVVATNKAAVG